MSKKVLSLVLALVMVLGSFGTVFAAAYPDVKGETADAVDRLSLLGILEGYPDGTFKPEGQITRAEFAAVAVRAKGLKAVAAAAQGLPTGFSDVPGTFWASGVVGTAARLGIVNGVGNGQFAPQSPVKYEEAITMLVRALGYEAAAQAKGGYPYGYLIVANEIDLLEAVKGTQGTAATRGQVAQLTDNALEIAMMVQVGYGSAAKWVVSGSKEHGEDAIYLLDEMGFDTYTGRVIAYDNDDLEITLDNEDEELKLKNITLEVKEGFDFYEAEGLTIKAWYTGGKVVLYTLKEEAKFDATEVVSGKLSLVEANKSYKIARDSYLEKNGKEVVAAFTSDYAKIVLNENSEVVWAKGYDLDYLIVEDVKSDIVYGYGNEELDVEDYLIVKDGKTITVKDIEEGDVLFFNTTNDFAEVYNNTVEGEISRVYEGSFRIDGKDYDTAGYYLDGKDLKALSSSALTSMQDEGSVVVFLDRNGNVVFVEGDLGIAPTTKSKVFVTLIFDRESNIRDTFRYYLDGVDQSGNKVKEVIPHSVLRSSVAATVKAEYLEADKANTESTWNALTDKNTRYDSYITANFRSIEIGEVVTVTRDEDGDITAINLPVTAGTQYVTYTATGDDLGVKLDARYILNKRLASSVVVFDATNSDVTKVKATTWGELKDIERITKADVYFDVNNNATTIVIETISNPVKTIDVVGIITDIRKVSGKLEWRVSAIVNGTEVEYRTAKSVNTDPGYVNGTVVVLKLDEKTNEISGFGSPDFVEGGFKNATDAKTGSVKVNGVNYTLVTGAFVVDVTNKDRISVISTRTLATMMETNNVTAQVVLDAPTTTFAKVILVEKGTVITDPKAPQPAEITVTYTAGTTTPDVVAPKLTVAVANVKDAYAVRVYDMDNNVLGFAPLKSGEADVTLASGAGNPVFVTVRVYDNAAKVLSEGVYPVN